MKIIHVHNVAFVATTLVDALNKKNNIKAIFFERPPYSEGIFTHIKNMIKFKKIIKKEKPDIVHIHYAPTAIYALFARVDFVLHIHGSDARGLTDITKLTKTKARLRSRFLEYSLKKAKLVFYSTPDLKKDLEIIRKDAIFIPNPVKEDRLIKNNYKLNNNKVNILFFASLFDAKGADIAFPALESLKETYKDDINIVCINFGPDKDKYNKSKGINYVNKVEHDKIGEFLGGFDIIIGQLKNGAIGVSELEVMMKGIPLVSNFKYNDFYVEPCPLISCDSSEEVIIKVQELIDNEKLSEIVGKKQMQWVKKYHEDTNVSNYLLKLYNKVIDEA